MGGVPHGGSPMGDPPCAMYPKWFAPQMVGTGGIAHGGSPMRDPSRVSLAVGDSPWGIPHEKPYGSPPWRIPIRGGSPHGGAHMGDPQWEITMGDHPWGIHHGELARANHLGWSNSWIWDFCQPEVPDSGLLQAVCAPLRGSAAQAPSGWHPKWLWH